MKKFLALCFALLFTCSFVACKGDDEDTNPPCSHSYEVTNAIDAKCNAYGSMTYTCLWCGDSYTETGTVYGEHLYEEYSSTQGTCQQQSSITHKCSVCGDTTTSYGSYGGHDYYAYSSTQGTCNQQSSSTQKCSTCGDTKTSYGSYGYHKGVKTCTTCSTSFYTLLKNYIMTNGIKTSSGIYGITLSNSSLDYTVLIYSPSNDYIHCSSQGSLGTAAVIINNDLTCEWFYETSTGYLFWGDISVSTFESGASITNYKTDASSSLASIWIGYARSGISVVFDRLASKITNANMGFTLYNLGFINY